jgi:hypothetical protein
MAKTKQKTSSETEHQKGLIRELQKQVKALTRQLKYLEKRDHLNDLPEPDACDEPISILVTEMKVPCLECGAGFYDALPILDKVYGNCNSCGHNKRLK